MSTAITDHRSQQTQNIAYQYDEVGNRVKETKNGVVTDYTYNDLNQLTKSLEKQGETVKSEKAYAYDKNGNQLSETDQITGESRLLTYDAAGSLARLVAKKGNTIEFTQENRYNGNGQRIQKTEADQTTKYYYQGSSVLYTKDGSDALTSQNLLGIGDNVIATTRGVGDAEKYYLYNKDVRESTSNVLDDEGESQVSYEYDDFGKTEVKGKQDFYNEICYTGGIYDESTGLYYLNARYYDPENANFLSQDTYRGEKDDPESLNLYAYCNNNPISYTDPSGHIPLLAVGLAIYRGYRIYKTAKRVYKTAKTVRKVYKGAKSIKRISSAKRSYRAVKATKKVRRAYSKPKSSKKFRKVTRRTYRPSRVKASKKRVVKKKVSAPKKTSKRWKTGDSITKKTSKGRKPSWSTVRSRYWKNEASRNSKGYSKRNLERMKKGKAPQRYNKETRKWESKELHHKFPRRKGGSHSKRNLKEVWPDEHANIDKFRHVRR